MWKVTDVESSARKTMTPEESVGLGGRHVVLGTLLTFVYAALFFMVRYSSLSTGGRALGLALLAALFLTFAWRTGWLGWRYLKESKLVCSSSFMWGRVPRWVPREGRGSVLNEGLIPERSAALSLVLMFLIVCFLGHDPNVFNDFEKTVSDLSQNNLVQGITTFLLLVPLYETYVTRWGKLRVQEVVTSDPLARVEGVQSEQEIFVWPC